MHEPLTNVFAKGGLDYVTSVMCKHQKWFGQHVQFSAYYFANDALIVAQALEPIKGKAEMIKIYAAAPANFEMDIKWKMRQGHI